jgi:hypothetical protein
METVLAVLAILEAAALVASSLLELSLEWREATGRAVA